MPTPSPKKIIIVEDDSVLQTGMRTALESAGFDVVYLASGGGVLSVVEKEKPDLVLLDLMLPEKDGYRVLYELKNNASIKHIPVIILTVVNSESSSQECEILGADDYLSKSDYSLEEIVEKVKDTLGV